MLGEVYNFFLNLPRIICELIILSLSLSLSLFVMVFEVLKLGTHLNKFFLLMF